MPERELVLELPGEKFLVQLYRLHRDPKKVKASGHRNQLYKL